MFRSVQSRYQTNGAQFLRVGVRSEVQEQNHVTILQLSLADDLDPAKALSAPRQILDKEAKCQAMTGRIHGRCCGLTVVRNFEV